jgi:hypothetical protein
MTLPKDFVRAFARLAIVLVAISAVCLIGIGYFIIVQPLAALTIILKILLVVGYGGYSFFVVLVVFLNSAFRNIRGCKNKMQN